MTTKVTLTAVEQLRDELYRYNSGQLRTDSPLASRTSYRVGGNAELLYSPYNLEDIQAAIQLAKEYKVPARVLGGGTNLLIADAGVPGLTIELISYCNRIECNGKIIRAEAGASLLSIVRTAVQNGLAGLSRLAGIPGSIGGGLRMNCGAFGSEISDFIVAVHIILPNGEQKRLLKSDVHWGYRQAPELSEAIIVSAEFELPAGSSAEEAGIVRSTLQQRREKQPLQYPSAGSVFKRPVNDYAGRLIEQAMLKGYRIGDAEVSTKHAGFIVNRGYATAKEIYELIAIVREKVFETSGVRLELEQVIWGFDAA